MLRALSFVLMVVSIAACDSGPDHPTNEGQLDTGVASNPPDAQPAMNDAGLGNADADEFADAAEDMDSGIEDGGIADAGTPPTAWETVRALFTSKCRRCHDGSATRPWDVTDPADVIGASSTSLSALQRVEAGSPERSFLYRKIQGTQAAACTENSVPTRNCGVRMPSMSSALTSEQIETVRAWIADGAIVD